MSDPRIDSLGAWWQAWEKRKEVPGGEAIARQLAENYVDAHRDELESRYAHLTQEQCVEMVGIYKRSNDQEKILEVKCWIMSEYPPQHIGGRGEVILRRGQRGK